MNLLQAIFFNFFTAIGFTIAYFIFDAIGILTKNENLILCLGTWHAVMYYTMYQMWKREANK